MKYLGGSFTVIGDDFINVSASPNSGCTKLLTICGVLSFLLLFVAEARGFITTSFSGDRGGVIGGIESCLDATTTSGISRHGESGSTPTVRGDGDVVAVGTTVLALISGVLLILLTSTVPTTAAVMVISSDFFVTSLPDEVIPFTVVALLFFEGIRLLMVAVSSTSVSGRSKSFQRLSCVQSSQLALSVAIFD